MVVVKADTDQEKKTRQEKKTPGCERIWIRGHSRAIAWWQNSGEDHSQVTRIKPRWSEKVSVPVIFFPDRPVREVL